MGKKKKRHTDEQFTAARWATESDDPYAMLYYLEDHYRPSERKARLFSCASVRHTLGKPKKRWQKQALDVGERYADGLATAEELTAAIDACLEHPDESYWALSSDSCVEAVETIVHTDRDSDSFHCDLVRCIFGNPFHPVTIDKAWQTRVVMALAESIYDERTFDQLPILADALEEAGCANADILAHLRFPSSHYRGCWVVDALLGKT